MNYMKGALTLAITFLTMGVTSMAAFGFLGFGNSFSWKEEVLLHDGQKIIVERSQIREGRHEIGQGPPVKEHSITFTPPGTNNPIIWKSEFTPDIGHSNFDLLALDIINGTPYIVTAPTGCIAYNKWERPNPPYIFFKYVDKEWKQIPLKEFPSEIKLPNVVLRPGGEEKVIKEEEQKMGFIAASKIKELNSSLRQDEYKTIVRELIKGAGEGCPVLVRMKDGWEEPGGAKSPIPISPVRPGGKN